MKTITISSKSIKTLLKRDKIATIEELKAVLGTRAPITVFRKLSELGYFTSYTHGNRYYTLKSIPHFDEQGLWLFQSVGFSIHGKLMDTMEHCIKQSEEGMFGDELKGLLHVDVNSSLSKLFKQGRIARIKYLGRYLYCAVDPAGMKRQITNREASNASHGTRAIIMGNDWVSDEIKAAIILFVSLLDEKQRRIFAGLESLQFGYGGDNWIAQLLSLDPHTVAKGRRELIERDIFSEGIREAGAGRPDVKKNA